MLILKHSIKTKQIQMKMIQKILAYQKNKAEKEYQEKIMECYTTHLSFKEVSKIN